MKVVAWISAFMICGSVYAAYWLEGLKHSGQASQAPGKWNEAKQTVQDEIYRTARQLSPLSRE